MNIFYTNKNMLKKLIVAILGSFTTILNAQNPEDYINKYKKIAIHEMKEYGIPASIKLAQGILESSSGKSPLAKESKNHFGIKCHNSWTGETITHDDDEDDECFRVYDDEKNSFEDHSKFLTDNPRYQDLFKLDARDYKSWAKGLKAKGYATNPAYADKLIEIIERYRLYEYDNALEINGVDVLLHPNRIKYIKAAEGQSFENIADNFGVSVQDLIDYNDWDISVKPKMGDIIFLQEKRNYGHSKTHTVREGETLHMIAQLNGIKLKSLFKRNNLKVGFQLKEGAKLVLRKYR